MVISAHLYLRSLYLTFKHSEKVAHTIHIAVLIHKKYSVRTYNGDGFHGVEIHDAKKT